MRMKIQVLTVLLQASETVPKGRSERLGRRAEGPLESTCRASRGSGKPLVWDRSWTRSRAILAVTDKMWARQATVLQREATHQLGEEMLYDLCSRAASYITERHIDSVRGIQPSLEDQRRKRGEEQAKVRPAKSTSTSLFLFHPARPSPTSTPAGYGGESAARKARAREARSRRSSETVAPHLRGCPQERGAAPRPGTPGARARPRARQRRS